MNYDYVVHDGKRLFVIEVPKSGTEVSLGGKVYVRLATTPRSSRRHPSNHSPNPASNGCRRRSRRIARPAPKHERSCSTTTRACSASSTISGKLLYPKGASVPTDNPEGKMLLRILFASCADTFETFMSDLLYEIYLAKPETLKSDAPVKVKDVLDRADMDEFITWYAKEKLKKLQRGSVKGFIAENPTIKSLNVFDDTRIDEIEKILQIRHLFTHQNGIVDDKFRQLLPGDQRQRRIPHDPRRIPEALRVPRRSQSRQSTRQHARSSRSHSSPSTHRPRWAEEVGRDT